MKLGIPYRHREQYRETFLYQKRRMEKAGRNLKLALEEALGIYRLLEWLTQRLKR